MKKILFITLLCLFGNLAYSAQSLKKESLGAYEGLEVIQFNGHTYVKYYDLTDKSATNIMHDPGCSCMKRG